MTIVVFKENQKKPGINPRKPTGGSQPPKNNKVVIAPIRMICAYSAKKNIANVIAEYSVLNPETSSDSPSAMSKGARFVSARAETKNIPKAGKSGMANQISSCAITNSVRFRVPAHKIVLIIINPIDTS